MNRPRQRLSIAIATMALLVAAPASAQETEGELVPPGNSAVNQYTEAVPTGGGEKDLEGSSNGRAPSPQRVLGAGNAKKLERHGPAGKAAAAVAAETAPTPGPAPERAPPSPDNDGGGGGSSAGGSVDDRDDSSSGAPSGEKRPPSGGAPAPEPVGAPDVSGGSGFGEVLAQATGSASSGEMGLWLPLLILATLVWAAVYGTRRTRGATQ